ncbi:MAG: hypothetical protein HYX87_08745 [Chloroflexi bacterium]|nr:hypothetical protein [Chloroflexota bacterium]
MAKQATAERKSESKSKTTASKGMTSRSTTKSKASRGESYSCQTCGLVVTVDETCGCVEAHDIICCDQPMKATRSRATSSSRAKAKKEPVKAA